MDSNSKNTISLAPGWLVEHCQILEDVSMQDFLVNGK